MPRYTGDPFSFDRIFGRAAPGVAIWIIIGIFYGIYKTGQWVWLTVSAWFQ